MANKIIDDLRSELDEIDDRIVELLDQRVEKAVLVGAAKAAAGVTQIYVPEREAEILKRLGRKKFKKICIKDLEEVYLKIFAVCRKVQAGDNEL